MKNQFTAEAPRHEEKQFGVLSAAPRLGGEFLLFLLLFFSVASAQTDPARQSPIQEAERLNSDVIRLYREGKFDKALEPAIRVVLLREQALGTEHPLVGNAWFNLATVHVALGNSGNAESGFRLALAIAEKHHGVESPMLCPMIESLAWQMYAIGRREDAERGFLRSLAIREKSFGAASREVAASLHTLAQFKQETGEYGEAVAGYQREARILEALPPGGDTDRLAAARDACACAAMQDGLANRATTRQAGAAASRASVAVVDDPNALVSRRPVHRELPDYPDVARTRNIGGYVVVRLTLDATGNVVEARTWCGPGLLRRPAEAAARGWKFAPVSGKATPDKGLVTFAFTRQ